MEEINLDVVGSSSGANFVRKASARPSTSSGRSAKASIDAVEDKLLSSLMSTLDGALRDFKRMDYNGNGRINMEHFIDILQSKFSIPWEEAHRLALAHNIGGSVDYKKFCGIIGSRVHGHGKDKPSLPDYSHSIEYKLAKHVYSSFANVQSAFKSMDKCSTGELSYDEFKGVLLSHGFRLEEDDFNEIFKRYDIKGNRRIQYTLFNEKLLKILQPTASKLKRAEPVSKETGVEEKFASRVFEKFALVNKAFAFMDGDKRGMLDKEDFRAVLKEYDLDVGESEFRKLLAKYGQNGRVDYMKFSSQLCDVLSPKLHKNLFVQPEKAHNERMEKAPQRVLDSIREVESKLVNKVTEKFSKVQNAFRSVDVDHSGSISYDEFREALERFGIRVSDEEFKILVKRYDTDGDGMIQYREFNDRFGAVLHPKQTADIIDQSDVGAARRRALLRAHASASAAKPGVKQVVEEIQSKLAAKVFEQFSKVRSSFRTFDLNGDGRISRSEFKTVMARFGLQLSESELDALMDEYELDEDGNITYEEFAEKFGRVFMPSLDPADTFLNASGKSRTMPMTRRIKDQLDSSVLSSVSRLRGAFKRYDCDDSGSINPTGFRRVLEVNGFVLDTPEFMKLVKALDPLDNGVVSYEEFLASFEKFFKAGAEPIHRRGSASFKPPAAKIPTHMMNNDINNAQVRPSTGMSISSRSSKFNSPLAASAAGNKMPLSRLSVVKDMNDSDNILPPFSPMAASGGDDTMSEIESADVIIRQRLKTRWRPARKALIAADKGKTGAISAGAFKQAIKKSIGVDLSDQSFQQVVGAFSQRTMGRTLYNYNDFLRSFMAGTDAMTRTMRSMSSKNSLISTSRLNSGRQTTLPPLSSGMSVSSFRSKASSDSRLSHMSLSSHVSRGSFRSRLEFPHEKYQRSLNGSQSMSKLSSTGTSADVSDWTKSRVMAEWKNIRKMCAQLDIHRSGCIDVDDFGKILSRCQVRLPEEEKHNLMEAFSVGDGMIQYDDLLRSSLKN
eukprot:TRINITY_DN777860_c0_g1_i1.p1 TRINITY_DN777860_c0_g1~~TRINITY_DN777860_c0_g1_i1.p1  ORF type:complete len:1044 (-),score=324.99 TRINITY_DN777860_c0_g1_i1:749-3778(-)